jgi:alpha-glucosidase
VPQHPLGQADISEQDYNVYGLAENIHDFRLGTNYTQTFYATDSGNTVDGNVYGQFPFYQETRYGTNGSTSAHGVYARNGPSSPAGNFPP